jgi:hypothetical protein
MKRKPNINHRKHYWPWLTAIATILSVNTFASESTSAIRAAPAEVIMEKGISRDNERAQFSDSQWAFTFEGGFTSQTSSQIGLGIDRLLQMRRFGTLTLGPTLRYFPNTSLSSGGVRSTFQLQITESQWAFPFLQLEQNFVFARSPRDSESGSRWASSRGFGGGMLFDLTRIDSDWTVDFYTTTGIQRVFLATEWRRETLKNEAFSTAGTGAFILSLRAEM